MPEGDPAPDDSSSMLRRVAAHQAAAELEMRPMVYLAADSGAAGAAPGRGGFVSHCSAKQRNAKISAQRAQNAANANAAAANPRVFIPQHLANQFAAMGPVPLPSPFLPMPIMYSTAAGLPHAVIPPQYQCSAAFPPFGMMQAHQASFNVTAPPAMVVSDYCHGCGQHGHSRANCSWQPCFKCAGIGHAPHNCPATQRSDGGGATFRRDAQRVDLRHLIQSTPRICFGPQTEHDRICAVLRRSDFAVAANDIHVPLSDPKAADGHPWVACEEMPGADSTLLLPDVDDDFDAPTPPTEYWSAAPGDHAVTLCIGNVPAGISAKQLHCLLHQLCGIRVLALRAERATVFDPAPSADAGSLWSVTVQSREAPQLVGMHRRIVVQSDRATRFATVAAADRWLVLRDGAIDATRLAAGLSQDRRKAVDALSIESNSGKKCAPW